ncbi:hypothetical protein HYH03_011495 [Edaphochlamys debaryana]|uniref:Uncharacterized protein n=1 Tax=Edaphochlamys debaryana TaxID=47281 RepID=A0A836BV34_9CHLO|nr:hypothetical protein HYH03_011495 [Edaphochlamys debaryana]|eukprot:KAG2490030.1 hypothetical protein HYH03_011495 [Edaphochlamys debaryana]
MDDADYAPKRERPGRRRGWTSDELALLARIHALHGNKWTLIAKSFRDKTDMDVKNMFHSTLRCKSGAAAGASHTLLRAYVHAVGPTCDDEDLRKQAYEAARQQAKAGAASGSGPRARQRNKSPPTSPLSSGSEAEAGAEDSAGPSGASPRITHDSPAGAPAGGSPGIAAGGSPARRRSIPATAAATAPSVRIEPSSPVTGTAAAAAAATATASLTSAATSPGGFESAGVAQATQKMARHSLRSAPTLRNQLASLFTGPEDRSPAWHPSAAASPGDMPNRLGPSSGSFGRGSGAAAGSYGPGSAIQALQSSDRAASDSWRGRAPGAAPSWAVGAAQDADAAAPQPRSERLAVLGKRRSLDEAEDGSQRHEPQSASLRSSGSGQGAEGPATWDRPDWSAFRTSSGAGGGSVRPALGEGSFRGGGAAAAAAAPPGGWSRWSYGYDAGGGGGGSRGPGGGPSWSGNAGPLSADNMLTRPFQRLSDGLLGRGASLPPPPGSAPATFLMPSHTLASATPIDPLSLLGPAAFGRGVAGGSTDGSGAHTMPAGLSSGYDAAAGPRMALGALGQAAAFPAGGGRTSEGSGGAAGGDPGGAAGAGRNDPWPSGRASLRLPPSASALARHHALPMFATSPAVALGTSLALPPGHQDHLRSAAQGAFLTAPAQLQLHQQQQQQLQQQQQQQQQQLQQQQQMHLPVQRGPAQDGSSVGVNAAGARPSPRDLLLAPQTQQSSLWEPPSWESLMDPSVL